MVCTSVSKTTLPTVILSSYVLFVKVLGLERLLCTYVKWRGIGTGTYRYSVGMWWSVGCRTKASPEARDKGAKRQGRGYDRGRAAYSEKVEYVVDSEQHRRLERH